jgi:hypothetical protein
MLPPWVKMILRLMGIVGIIFAAVSFAGVIPGIPKYWGLGGKTLNADVAEYDKFLEELAVPMGEKLGFTAELIDVFNEKKKFLRRLEEMTPEKRDPIKQKSTLQKDLTPESGKAANTCVILASADSDDTRDELLENIKKIEKSLSDLHDVDDFTTLITTEGDMCAYKTQVNNAMSHILSSTDLAELKKLDNALRLSSSYLRLAKYGDESFPNVTCM